MKYTESVSTDWSFVYWGMQMHELNVCIFQLGDKKWSFFRWREEYKQEVTKNLNRAQRTVTGPNGVGAC